MSREIRRVPLDWEHPQNEHCPHLNGLDWSHKRHHSPEDFQYGKCFIPLLDEDYKSAKTKWLTEMAQWEDGTHPDLVDDPDLKNRIDFWEWIGGPPDRDDYRPAFTSDPIGYQIYETVSEGTPVSPIFATKEEIVEYLVTKGYTPTAATQFVKDEWAISMVYTPQTGLIDGIEACDIN